jgi:WD40 repeat protein
MSSDDEYDPAAVAGKRPMESGDGSGAPLKAHRSEIVGVAGGSTRGIATAASTSTSFRGPTLSGVVTVSTTAKVVRLRGHERAVKALALSPAGNCLVTSGTDGNVNMWEYAKVAAAMTDFSVNAGGELRAAKPTRSITPFMAAVHHTNQPVTAAAWLCDGKHFVACENGPCPILIRADGKTMQPCKRGYRGSTDVAGTDGHIGEVTACDAHSREESQFATSSTDGTIRLWTTPTMTEGSTYAAKHGMGSVTEAVQALHVRWAPTASAAAPLLLSCGSDGLAQLWAPNRKYVPRGSAFTIRAGTGGGAAAGTSGGSLSLDSWSSAANVTAVLSGCIVPWQSNHVALRLADGTLRFYDLRGDMSQEVEDRIGGLSIAGECAPLLPAVPQARPDPCLYAFADMTSPGAFGGSAHSGTNGSYAVLIGKHYRATSAHLVTTDGHVTGATCNDATQQLMVGDHRGLVHAMLYPSTAGGANGAADSSWVPLLKGAASAAGVTASKRSGKQSDDDEGDEGLPSFLR